MKNEIIRSEKTLDLLGQLASCEEAGSMYAKGYRYSDISEVLDITPLKAKDLVAEYFYIMEQNVENDPHFLDRIGLNTTRLLKELDEINREVWETLKIATDSGMVTARTQSLKLALEVSTKKAALLQLMGGGVKDNSDSYARTQKAETVNQLLSRIIRDVIGDCDRCRERARDMLAQAFSLMEETEDAIVVEG